MSASANKASDSKSSVEEDTNSALIAGAAEQPKMFATKDKLVVVPKDSFDMDNHFYPKTINAQVSEIVSDFMVLGKW